MKRRDALALTLAGVPGLAYGQYARPKPPNAESIKLLAHFCTWHRKRPGLNSWSQASTIPYRTDGSGIGYDSLDPIVLRQQCAEMSVNGIIPLTSWWGPKHLAGDEWLDLWVSEPRPVPAAVLYEGQDDTRIAVAEDGWRYMDISENADTLRRELQHLHDRYFSKYPKHFYKVSGKTFVLLWPAHGWRGDLSAVLSPLSIRSQLFLVGTALDELRLPNETRIPVLSALDGVTGYNMYSALIARQYDGMLTTELIARYRNTVLVWQDWLAKTIPNSKLILPMTLAYDDTHVPGRTNPVYSATPDDARRLMAEMYQIISHFVLHCGNVLPLAEIASYNEHFEGSAIEPNNGLWGNEWLSLIRDGLVTSQLPAPLCTN